jgi:ubiquinone/menaquinone biosynthesis C-methylase UbiE
VTFNALYRSPHSSPIHGTRNFRAIQSSCSHARWRNIIRRYFSSQRNKARRAGTGDFGPHAVQQESKNLHFSMDHRDHVNLLRSGISQPGGTWADFGSGGGAFTLALRELVGPDAEIFSIDQDAGRLREQERAFQQRFPQSQFPTSHIHFIRADFTRALELPPLDGLVMANALHYFKDKEKLLKHVRGFLKADGVLLVVEYNVDVGNPWVPHPLSFETFQKLAPRAGFSAPRLLATAPSRFLSEFFAAAARNG